MKQRTAKKRINRLRRSLVSTTDRLRDIHDLCSDGAKFYECVNDAASQRCESASATADALMAIFGFYRVS